MTLAREALPILARKCYACHGPDQSESGLSLHTRHGALSEAGSGNPAIVPREPGASELIRRVTSADEWERMPPEGEPLSERDVSLLREWIARGAEYQRHWAFEPLAAHPLPVVIQQEWVQNPIDAFLLAKLEARGLAPTPPADRRDLARRVYFDVTGLPPTPDEMSAFLGDSRPDAYEKLVDRLLASPRYGEKWARHWLDVVRYAESNSFERDAPKPYVWRYRDYVIQSLNNDKPYDQFLREQLAGDEQDEITDESITATAYYRLGTWDDEPADRLQAMYDDLDSIVSTTGQAMLGLTVGCARCHDHKIDPIPQSDYYRLLAFFADVTPYAHPDRRDASHNSLWDLSPPAQKEQREQLKRQRDKLAAQLHELEQLAIQRMEGEDQHRTETDQRERVLDKKLHLYHTDEESSRYREVQRNLGVIDQRIEEAPEPRLTMALARCEPRPEPMHVMLRGNPHAPGEQVAPGFPKLFGAPAPTIPPPAEGARSAGRRRVLAEWITHDDNPLTSRVIVNRVWQHHFGRGIVRSPNNFGLLGVPPTHPELLDWLAQWLLEHEWRLKPLHRLILTSNAYRMASTASEEGLAADPANDSFWRFNPRRLSAEEIRDSALLVSGGLNEERYGPSFYPKLSDEVLATQSRPGENWGDSSEEEASRRSIYMHIKRSVIPPEMASFDFPDTDTSCEARFNTVQAAQALNLLHGAFFRRQAERLAARVREQEPTDPDGQVRLAMSLALQREPDEATVEDGLRLIARCREKHGLGPEESLQQFCLVTLNLNEFIYID